ncbi:MAG: MoaD/ThiS family protein [Candidatus Bathyarchaeota archaeon]|jgi:molybdopterin converting factor small subunit|nr:MoaD/ThiS family protein [Candidatus Bathyarchaeota archaeon]|tara:strand:- start:205 stop:489 length:285 start_codon:yes stop_codon:yes gene_type:complete
MIVDIKIYYYSVFGKGNISLEFQGEEVTIQDILSRLEKNYGEAFKCQSGRTLIESFGTYFNLFLNDEYIPLPEQTGRKLNDNDALVILHPVSGG